MGAWLNDRQVTARSPDRRGDDLRGVLKKRFLPDDVRVRVDSDSGVLTAGTEGRNCAGLDYPDLAVGVVDFLFYWRTLAVGSRARRSLCARGGAPSRPPRWQPL